jgi:hypothetical protein
MPHGARHCGPHLERQVGADARNLEGVERVADWEGGRGEEGGGLG